MLYQVVRDNLEIWLARRQAADAELAGRVLGVGAVAAKPRAARPDVLADARFGGVPFVPRGRGPRRPSQVAFPV